MVSLQIHIYGPFSQEPVKAFTRFKDTAYCGRFRSDGQLLVAGCEDSVVRLFDVSGKVALRMFKGHTKWVFHLKDYLNQLKYKKTILTCQIVFWICFAIKELLNDDSLSDPSTEFYDDLKSSDNL